MVVLCVWAFAGRAQNDDKTANSGRPDLVIADFEGRDFGAWKTTGTAFGAGPAKGALPGQLPTTGFLGRGLANSFHGGDNAIGTLTSPMFKIDRNYITFLIGAAGQPRITYMSLTVDGNVVRRATGMRKKLSEALAWESWDVSDLIGKTAQIQIVDGGGGPWAHISVDQITESDAEKGIIFAGRRKKEPVNQATALVANGTPAIATPTVVEQANQSPARTESVATPTAVSVVAAAAPLAAEQNNQFRSRRARAVPPTTALAAGAPAQLRLDEFSHALDVQLVDSLGASKLFSVVEDKDLKEALHTAVSGAVDFSAPGRRKLAIAGVNAVPTLANRYALPQSGQDYDLKNPNTLALFNKTGINFLVLTTLEDVDENHIDGVTVTRDFEYVDGHQTGWWVQESEGISGDEKIRHSGAHASSSSWTKQTVHVNPMMQKEQSLRVTLRSRLFDAKTGELLGSRNKTYARGRSYMASARGNNELSMGDLYQTTAEDLAVWARDIVEDEAFPMKVLKIDDEGLLMNRGMESGVRKNGRYTIWMMGGEIKDPDTGEVLGKEEKNVGSCYITELQSKFSRAKITENNGILVGSILRLAH